MLAHAPTRFGLLEHRADVGFWMESSDLTAIFHDLSAILAEIMVSGPRNRPFERRRVKLEAPLPELLLADLASEVVYLWDAEGLIATNCDILTLNDTSIEADIDLCPFDPAVHEVQMAVKAVTYHQASLRAAPGGWRAELYLDV
jgi:SHS2 domain-containing protein